MSTEAAQVAKTKSGIPIRNIWHMLMYAWGAQNFRSHWRGAVEDAPTLDALLAGVLNRLIQQRLRIGLGRDYIPTQAELGGIRGRLQFTECTKRMSFQHGRAVCRYQTYSPNVLKNQIVKGTLNWLIRKGEFSDSKYGNELRATLRGTVHSMENVEDIAISIDTIARESVKRHDRDYGLMLAICDVILKRQMPMEDEGLKKLSMVDRDSLTLWLVFEQFVANFYQHHLTNCKVSPQAQYLWPSETSSPLLPKMRPDLLIQSREPNGLIVLDTKFYVECLVKSSTSDKQTFRSANLYQMYAYLMSQSQRSTMHASATGILLYPTVDQAVSESVTIQGHRIMWETIDLRKPWPEIEERLVGIVSAVWESKTKGPCKFAEPL